MALEAGSRVGSYEIVTQLGEGGMSEVYRARDLELGRDVALKLLPEHWADDRERVQRFEREAQLLAALHHPNIAIIHGIERERSRVFLVLELIPGETLHERLARGPLSFDEARRIFVQVARALEVAHEKNIIHRDLKPGNIKVTADGTVKLLDFGLGKDVRPQNLTEKTSTYVGPGTEMGLVMGTPAYMSPEQSRGRTVGKATDIWSFGVCLFESLSGRNPFLRDTLPDTLSAILNDEPPWTTLPRGVPRGVETLLRRTLRKDVASRLHDIADARLELEEATEEESPSAPGPSRWRLALGLALVAALAAILGRGLGGSAGPSPAIVRRFVLELPAAAPLSLENGEALAASPDGTRIAYAARLGERKQLYLRASAQLEAIPVPSTEDAEAPFFSPDGDELGFVAGGKLRKLSLASLAGGGGANLAEAPSPRGSTWATAQTIVLSPSSAGGLVEVGANGGPTEPLTELDEKAEERDHRWPVALPGGRAVVFTVWKPSGFDLEAVDVSSGKRQHLLEDASYARYARTGHLLFARDGDLYAARFDPRSLQVTGEPRMVLEDVAYDANTGAAFFDLSEDGDLYYVQKDTLVEAGRSRAFLVDASGNARPLGEPRTGLQVPRLTPDGRKLVMTVADAATTDLWMFDLDRGGQTRLTVEGNNGAGVVTPDGSRVAFASDRDGVFSIYWTRADGSGGEERLTRAEHPQFPTSFSPDGKYLALSELHPDTSFDLYVLSLPDRKRTLVLATAFEEAGAMFSPDGRFLAYTSNESGRQEVYVRPFRVPEARFQVSVDSGAEPLWSRDGRKLFFRRGAAMLVADVESDDEFRAGKPRLLFEEPFDTAGALYPDYDVTPNGENFVMIRSERQRTASRIYVVTNWLRELQAQLP